MEGLRGVRFTRPFCSKKSHVLHGSGGVDDVCRFACRTCLSGIPEGAWRSARCALYAAFCFLLRIKLRRDRSKRATSYKGVVGVTGVVGSKCGG